MRWTNQILEFGHILLVEFSDPAGNRLQTFQMKGKAEYVAVGAASRLDLVCGKGLSVSHGFETAGEACLNHLGVAWPARARLGPMGYDKVVVRLGRMIEGSSQWAGQWLKHARALAEPPP